MVVLEENLEKKKAEIKRLNKIYQNTQTELKSSKEENLRLNVSNAKLKEEKEKLEKNVETKKINDKKEAELKRENTDLRNLNYKNQEILEKHEQEIQKLFVS